MAEGLHLGSAVGIVDANDAGVVVEGRANSDGDSVVGVDSPPSLRSFRPWYRSSSQTNIRRAISKISEGPPLSVCLGGCVVVVSPLLLLILDLPSVAMSPLFVCLFSVALSLVVVICSLISSASSLELFFRRFFAISKMECTRR